MELIIDSDLKTCTKCKETYEATEENFYKQKTVTKTKGTFYKLSSWCKPCKSKQSTKWQQSIDPERRKKIKREHSKKRKLEGKEQAWRNANKDKLNEYSRARRMNKEHDITE